MNYVNILEDNMELTGQVQNLKLGKTDRQYLVLQVKFGDVKGLFDVKPSSKARVDTLKRAINEGTFTPAAIYAGLNEQVVQQPAANTATVDVKDSKLCLLKGNRQLGVLTELAKEDATINDVNLLLVLFLDRKNEQDIANLHAGKPGRKTGVFNKLVPSPVPVPRKPGRPRKTVEQPPLESLSEVADKIPWEENTLGIEA
jgi:hypothetical protein